VICCTTPGVGLSGGQIIKDTAGFEITAAVKGHESISFVVGSVTGTAGPVDVLAAVNASVIDSFITMNLVEGLGREKTMVRNEQSKLFEITLDIVVGLAAKEGGDVTISQSFVVFDGERLLEEEQILVGSGFLGRIGALGFEKGVVGEQVKGLPLASGPTA
jgi:hypothetical protein